MKKLYLLTPRQLELGITCTFEYYSDKTKDLYLCGKPAVFRFGSKTTEGICKDCAQILSGNGVLTVAKDGFEYSSAMHVLKTYGHKGANSEKGSKKRKLS